MKNTTEQTRITLLAMATLPIGPADLLGMNSGLVGLTPREYKEMKAVEEQERQDYLDYINER